MLITEIFREISLKKDPVILLLSKLTPPKETYDQMDQIG